MLSDIEISQQAKLKHIGKIASALGISDEVVEPYGKYKAKVDPEQIETQGKGKLILVTAITPTPAGEGKSTTTIGLGDALNKIGHKTVVCLREPALGPVFGMKGGATGGGYAQVAPMEDINLHFTGDFHAIATAHNLLSALIDNHIHWGNKLGIDPNRITWPRVMDMNDRLLRDVVVGLGAHNGVTRQDNFDIVVASEVMAVLCLAENLQDLKTRLGKITVGYDYEGNPVTAKDLKANGAMAAVLKDAIKPNLVQTLEGNPAFVHGGPFANIAHGCNSVIATKLGLRLAEYVVTEAGFGADLGAEKFIDIKCRKSKLKPSAVVLVATVRALKHHGNGDLARGMLNLQKHIENITNHYSLPCVVAINKFENDSDAELEYVSHYVQDLGVEVELCEHWAKGSAGAVGLAKKVVDLADRSSTMQFVYEDEDILWNKIRKVSRKIYGARDIDADNKVREKLKELQKEYGDYPICVAKTQSSFSTDPNLVGAPKDHIIHIREVRLCTGAEFIVVVCGNILTMPGLPKDPNAHRINIDKNGNITGLS